MLDVGWYNKNKTRSENQFKQMTANEALNKFMEMFQDKLDHGYWVFHEGKRGAMKFITPSDFYNAFASCSTETIESAINLYLKRKRKR